MKEKIEEMLNKRIEMILEKSLENITNEEFALLEVELHKINTKESDKKHEEKNKEFVDIITKYLSK